MLSFPGIPETPVNVTVKPTSASTVLVSWVSGYHGGANCTFTVQFKRSDVREWISSDDALLGNATNTVLTNEEGWNGLFIFRVTAVNQFGSSESNAIQVTLGMSYEGCMVRCQSSQLSHSILPLPGVSLGATQKWHTKNRGEAVPQLTEAWKRLPK